MKKIYNLILTLLTIAMLGLMCFSKVNSTANWVDLTAYEPIFAKVFEIGPMLLLCLFAFGGLFGKIMSKIFFVILLLLLVVFGICMFAPQWITSIFGGAEAESVIKLINFIC